MIFTTHKFPDHYLSEYSCRCDDQLTLIGDHSGLTRLLGYSADELTNTYQNSFLALVAPNAKKMLQIALSETDEIECVIPVYHKNGHVLWLLNKAVRVTDHHNCICVHGVLVDITKLKHEYDREKNTTHVWEEEAKKDSLTHIYNAYYTRKLAEAYIQETNNTAALLIIDLDDFKQINDSHGHLFGDAVLVQTAQIIKKLFRSEDIVGRIGGEEFMVLMKGTTDMNILHNRCQKLNEALKSMFGDNIPVCNPSCSIGIALFPQHADSYFELFSNADRALYFAKANGKRQYALYNKHNHQMNTRNYSLRSADYDEKTLRGYIDIDEPR